MAAIRLKVPASAREGDVVEIKALIQHDMESGYRLDNKGEPIARNILTEFTCDYGGQTVFSANLGPGIAANPIVTFYLRAAKSGEVTFTWVEQTGRVFTDTARLEVI